MNREHEFELRLAEWLEDGPFSAPDRVVATAIEHARTHPRRRPLRIAFWRSAMNETHAAPGAPRHLWQLHRSLSAAVAVIAVVAIVAASGAVLLSMNRNSQGGPGPVVTPVPTPTPSPVTVTGTVSTADVRNGSDTTIGGVEQIRGTKFTAKLVTSDPRTSGDATVEGSMDIYPDSTAQVWGTMTLTGPGGTWDGYSAGVIGLDAVHRIDAVLMGKGGYEGLQYRFTETSQDGEHFTLTGLIEAVPSYVPAAAFTGTLAVTGADTCSTSIDPPATQTVVGSVTQTRNASSVCTENTSDSRTNGQSSRTVDMDIAADGLGTMWGTGRIVNSGGAWTGVFTGTVDGNGTTTITFAYVGSGSYAGYRFVGTAVSTGGSDTFTVDGTVKAIA